MKQEDGITETALFYSCQVCPVYCVDHKLCFALKFLLKPLYIFVSLGLGLLLQKSNKKDSSHVLYSMFGYSMLYGQAIERTLTPRWESAVIHMLSLSDMLSLFFIFILLWRGEEI